MKFEICENNFFNFPVLLEDFSDGFFSDLTGWSFTDWNTKDSTLEFEQRESQLLSLFLAQSFHFEDL